MVRLFGTASADVMSCEVENHDSCVNIEVSESRTDKVTWKHAPVHVGRLVGRPGNDALGARHAKRRSAVLCADRARRQYDACVLRQGDAASRVQALETLRGWSRELRRAGPVW